MLLAMFSLFFIRTDEIVQKGQIRVGTDRNVHNMASWQMPLDGVMLEDSLATPPSILMTLWGLSKQISAAGMWKFTEGT